MAGAMSTDWVGTRSATLRRHGTVRLVAFVAIVLVVVGWFLRPDALRPVTNGVGLEALDDQPRLTGEVVMNRRTIQIVSVRPVNQPPEGAKVSFVACRWREPLQAFATASGPVTAHCAETRAVEGLVLEPRASRPMDDGTLIATRDWEVLAVIALGDQPSYLTEGFVVDYREGLRRGRQASGTRVAVYRHGEEPDW